MSDYDSDNICGFDMDYDGDRDIVDDMIYDDYFESENNNSDGGHASGSNISNDKPFKGIIIYIVLVIVFAIVSGSFSGAFGAAILVMGIIWYIKNFVL